MDPIPVISYAQRVPDRPPTRDAGLLFGMGMFFILFGCMAGMVVGIGGMLHVMQSGMPRQLRVVSASRLLVFAVAATALIWTGVGSIRLRRWVRPVVMSVTGITIAFSTVTLLVLGFLYATAPPVADLMQRRGRGRTRAAANAVAADGAPMLTITLLLVIVGILLPLGVLLIYRSRAVARTLEDADTRRRWIDGRPIPVIALAIASLMFAFALGVALFNLPPIPVGMVSAAAAEARVILGGAMIALAVFFVWAAWLNFRLHPLGPWLALLLIALGAAGAIGTMVGDALRSSFGRPGVNYAPYELTWYFQLSAVRSAVTVCMYAIPAALYVLYVRRVMLRMRTSEHPHEARG